MSQCHQVACHFKNTFPSVSNKWSFQDHLLSRNLLTKSSVSQETWIVTLQILLCVINKWPFQDHLLIIPLPNWEALCSRDLNNKHAMSISKCHWWTAISKPSSKHNLTNSKSSSCLGELSSNCAESLLPVSSPSGLSFYVASWVYLSWLKEFCVLSDLNHEH